jgi:RecA/RadA recombinase
MINVTGGNTEIHRVVTGLYSFDHALANKRGDIGYPLGGMTEVFGPPGIGKSTTSLSLAGLICKGLGENHNIAIAPLEKFDPVFLVEILKTQGFEGEVYNVPTITDKDEDKKHEDVLAELLDKLEDRKSNYYFGILDAVGSVSPIAEAKGDLGDANMGRRALLINQLSRRANSILLNRIDKTLFVLNHQHERIGGMGLIAPGGKGKEFIASIRIHLTRVWRKNKEEYFPDGSYVVKGDIVKNRFGLENNTFYFFVLSGKGIHKGLTAVYDAVQLELVDRERTIKIGDQSFGFLKDVVQQAQDGNEEFFQPFYDVLKEHTESIRSEEENKENE